MAELITIQKLIDASMDSDSLEVLVNGDENAQVTTRLGETYPSAKKAIKTLFENGGLPATPFKTKALMTASALVDGKYAMVTNDTVNNGLYVKDNGNWEASSYTFDVVESYFNSIGLGGLHDPSGKIPLSKIQGLGTKLDGTGIRIERTQLYVNVENGEFKDIATGTSSSFLSYIGDLREYNNNTLEFKINTNVLSRSRLVLYRNYSDISNNRQSVKVVNIEDGLSELIVDVSGYEAFLIYLSSTNGNTLDQNIDDYLSFGTRMIETSYIISNDSVESRIIGVEDTDFITERLEEPELTPVTGTLIFVENGVPPYLYSASIGVAYAFDIAPSEYVEIERHETNGNRFRIVGLNTNVVTPSSQIVSVINIDDTQRTASFHNVDGKVNKILVQVSNLSGGAIHAIPKVKILRRTIKGLGVSSSAEREVRGYSLEFGKTSLPNTLDAKPIYPRLACVRYEYTPNDFPNPIGYVYTSNDKFYYAHETPTAEKVYVANWVRSVTWSGNEPVHKYSQILTEDGDIICVTRGDLAGGNFNPNARQNPIVYPAGDYNNPVVVDLGDREKPTAWFMSAGVTTVPGEDCILFSEYTRPAHEKMYVWKVTKPYTDPNNWQIKEEFTVSRPGTPGEAGEGDMKHMHTMNYDPWSGMLVTSVGDYNYAPRILVSKDIGETWVTVAEGNEGHSRVINISFDKDAAWWGSDSHKENHIFWKAPRGEDGYVDFSESNSEKVYIFSEHNVQATYATIRLRSPNGFLFLDRHDGGPSNANLMRLNFWSLKNENMYHVAEFSKHDTYKASFNTGFRCDCFTYYQSPHYPDIAVGFNDAVNLNANDIAGNSIDNPANNLLLQLKIDT